MNKAVCLKVTADISEVDRISIGARLYDMLDVSKPGNVFHNGDGCLEINEEDIIKMFDLVNTRWVRYRKKNRPLKIKLQENIHANI